MRAIKKFYRRSAKIPLETEFPGGLPQIISVV